MGRTPTPQEGTEDPKTPEVQETTPPEPSEGEGTDDDLKGVPKWVQEDPQAAYTEIKKVRREAASLRTKLSEIEAEDARRQDDLLADQERWKELAEKRGTELEGLQSQFQQAQVQQAILSAASQARWGEENQAFTDPGDAVAMADMSQISFEDGGVVGVDEALVALAERKPHLLAQAGSRSKPPPPSPTNPAGGMKPHDPSWIRDRILNRGQTTFGAGQVIPPSDEGD
jgi:hypothetical protein